SHPGVRSAHTERVHASDLCSCRFTLWENTNRPQGRQKNSCGDPVPSHVLSFKFGEPTQRSQSRHEAIFAAPRDDKLRNALQTFSNWFSRQGKTHFVRSNDRIFISTCSKENAIIDPLRLNKLELAPNVCADKGEHQSTICSIIEGDSFG